jgi:hypothetical protein
MLWHGSKNPEMILGCEEGFDLRFSGGGTYGTAIYFARNASYSAPTYCSRDQ